MPPNTLRCTGQLPPAPTEGCPALDARVLPGRSPEKTLRCAIPGSQVLGPAQGHLTFTVPDTMPLPPDLLQSDPRAEEQHGCPPPATREVCS